MPDTAAVPGLSRSQSSDRGLAGSGYGFDEAPESLNSSPRGQRSRTALNDNPCSLEQGLSFLTQRAEAYGAGTGSVASWTEKYVGFVAEKLTTAMKYVPGANVELEVSGCAPPPPASAGLPVRVVPFDWK